MLYFSIWNTKLHAAEPLGAVRKLTLKIDGEEIEPSRIFFVVHDQWIGIEQMPTISEIWWMLREEAHIYVKQEGVIKPGTHNVECILENQLLVHTPAIDSKDIRPRIAVKLQVEMNTV